MTSARKRFKRMVALSVVVASATGCVAARSISPLPIPMHLSAKAEFLLHQSVGTDSLSQCAVRSAQVEVDSARADTLFVRRLVSVHQSHGVAKCRGVGAGYIVVSSSPSLSAQIATSSAWRSLGLVVIVLPLVILLGLTLAFGLGTS